MNRQVRIRRWHLAEWFPAGSGIPEFGQVNDRVHQPRILALLRVHAVDEFLAVDLEENVGEFLALLGRQLFERGKEAVGAALGVRVRCRHEGDEIAGAKLSYALLEHLRERHGALRVRSADMP